LIDCEKRRIICFNRIQIWLFSLTRVKSHLPGHLHFGEGGYHKSFPHTEAIEIAAKPFCASQLFGKRVKAYGTMGTIYPAATHKRRMIGRMWLNFDHLVAENCPIGQVQTAYGYAFHKSEG